MGATRYGLQGTVSRELLTLGGRVLTHHDRGELEFLVTGARVVTIPPDIPDEQTMPITAHPQLTGVVWPLRRTDFTH